MAKRKKTAPKKAAKKRRSKKAMRSVSVIPGFAAADVSISGSRKKRP